MWRKIKSGDQPSIKMKGWFIQDVTLRARYTPDNFQLTESYLETYRIEPAHLDKTIDTKANTWSF